MGWKMKKIFLLLLIAVCFFFTGCGKYGEKDVIKDLKKEINNSKGYSLTGTLKIVNNDDTYDYDVSVVYKENDLFKVTLRNKANDHEQIILKNKDGVYVVTPSLNKSFKFQSEWPYNNSQVYLLQSLLDDIESDQNRVFEQNDEGFVFTTQVNYPNNRKLINQKITLDKDLNIKMVEVYNENNVPQMTMVFSTYELNKDINDDEFNLNNLVKTIEPEEETTSTLDDIIYPLYIPSGTALVSQEEIEKTNGKRVIMTFEGEKDFLFIEETADIEEEFSIIPTYGEPYLLVDTVGALTETSVNWISNGVEYYLVSDVMSQDELVEIAKSVVSVGSLK